MLKHFIFETFDFASQFFRPHFFVILTVHQSEFIFEVIALVDTVNNVTDPFLNALRRDVVCDVVSRLFFSASSRFVHRSAHGIGNRIGIQNGFAFNISRSTSDGLNERTLASQEAFFIRIQDRNKRDLRDIEPETNTVADLIPQILPGSADEFRLLTDAVGEKGYRQIDINLGCPFPMIAGKHKGAGMLLYPAQVAEVLAPIAEYPEIQFSLKMRLGWENASECMVLVELLNTLRLSRIALHARTGKQQYKGHPDLEAFQGFYELCQHPLYYNGGIESLSDIRQILIRFPLLKGVFIGRGLLSSPLLAKEFKGNETFLPEQRMSIYFAFHEELFSAYSQVLQGETQLLVKMKTLWEYFLPETDRKLLKRIKKSTRLQQYTESVKAIFTS